MTRLWFGLALMLVLSYSGCLINQKLTLLHYQDSAGTGLFAEICTPDAEPIFDCKAVTKTKWAVLPPEQPDPVTGEQMGLPVALLGWFYFSAVFVWYLLIGRCDYERRIYHYLLLAVIVTGCATSAFYTYILLFSGMKHKCLWCMISHGINFLLLIGTILLRPRRPATTAPVVTAEIETATPGEVPPSSPVPVLQTASPAHPTWRLLAAALLCIVALGWGEQAVNGWAKYRRVAAIKAKEAEYYKRDAEIVYADTASHIARFDAQEQVKIPLRDDDPRRGGGDFPLKLVVFSDFECPGCRGFSRTLEKTIEADFEGLLQVWWKHYPLCKDCNPKIAKNMHPHACRAAYAAEAARLQGGNEAFWAAHDWLFEHQKNMKTLDYGALAEELNLDRDRFLADMESEEVKQRVAEDIELALSLKVTGTPTLFLNSRRIQRFMLTNEGFRRAINLRLQRARKHRIAEKRWQEMTPEERAEIVRRAQDAVKKRQGESPTATNGSKENASAPANDAGDEDL